MHITTNAIISGHPLCTHPFGRPGGKTTFKVINAYIDVNRFTLMVTSKRTLCVMAG